VGEIKIRAGGSQPLVQPGDTSETMRTCDPHGVQLSLVWDHIVGLWCQIILPSSTSSRLAWREYPSCETPTLGRNLELAEVRLPTGDDERASDG